MNFSEALIKLQAGCKMFRKGWLGIRPGDYIFQHEYVGNQTVSIQRAGMCMILYRFDLEDVHATDWEVLS